MKPSDAAQVLTLASVFDSRNFDEPTVRVWADALDGLELGDCLDAVRLHYRRSREWIMPLDVREHARTVIRERRELERQQSDRLAIEAANVDPQTVEQRIEEIRQAIANVGQMPAEESPHPVIERSVSKQARKFACPWCKAQVNAACTNTATGKPTETIHEKRLIAAGLLAAPKEAAA